MAGINDSLTALTQVNNIGFTDFTTGLVNGVFGSVVQASIDQLKAYASVVEQVAKTTDQFIKDTIGADVAAQTISADLFITETFGLAIPANAIATTNIAVTPEQFDTLVTAFTGFTDATTGKPINDASIMKAPVPPAGTTIKLGSLRGFVISKLVKTASETHSLLITMMKLGMQKVVVTKGLIRTKLTFDVSASDSLKQNTLRKQVTKNTTASAGGSASGGVGLSLFDNFFGAVGSSTRIGAGPQVTADGSTENSLNLNVNIASTRSSSASNLSAEIIGEVVIEFSTESFPSV
jgi:hypothetical protein